mgnify:CR=1 FL=1
MAKINKTIIGDGYPCYITFEIGPTHNGLDSAKRLIKHAADAGANEDGFFKIPILNEGFLSTGTVVVYLEAQEGGGTEYARQSYTIPTIPAKGNATAEFQYSDIPPGNARMTVSLEVLDDTPLHPDSEDSELFERKLYVNVTDLCFGRFSSLLAEGCHLFLAI